MTRLRLKRAYEPSSAEDGFRVYVDRLWPRGLSHATFHYDLWAKEIAPSDELRHWFHDNADARWEDFESRYIAELKVNEASSAFEDALKPHQVVTLIYSSHNEVENNAVVLRKFLVESGKRAFECGNAL